MKILIATEKPFAEKAKDGIREIAQCTGHELQFLERYTSKPLLLKAVADAHALIVRSDTIDKSVFEAAPQLKIVVRAGSGYDNVDLTAATERGVCVMNTPGQNSNATAELVFGLLIYAQRIGFCGASGTELLGKKIGLHAFGSIAKIVARIARCFGMMVYAYSPSLAKNPALAEPYGVIPVKTVEELYDTCEIISLHMPLTDETREQINYELMSRLPENAVIVNTARKEVINELDMIRILDERPGFKYATDMKAKRHEELVAQFGLRYVSSAKKCGAQTAEANINAGLAAANQIVDFFATGNETFRVN